MTKSETHYLHNVNDLITSLTRHPFYWRACTKPEKWAVKYVCYWYWFCPFLQYYDFDTFFVYDFGTIQTVLYFLLFNLLHMYDTNCVAITNCAFIDNPLKPSGIILSDKTDSTIAGSVNVRTMQLTDC